MVLDTVCSHCNLSVSKGGTSGKSRGQSPPGDPEGCQGSELSHQLNLRSYTVLTQAQEGHSYWSQSGRDHHRTGSVTTPPCVCMWGGSIVRLLRGSQWLRSSSWLRRWLMRPHPFLEIDKLLIPMKTDPSSVVQLTASPHSPKQPS